MPSRKVMIIIEYIKKYHYIKLVVIKNQIVVIEKKKKLNQICLIMQQNLQ